MPLPNPYLHQPVPIDLWVRAVWVTVGMCMGYPQVSHVLPQPVPASTSTLPSPTLPCGIQANSMESMWIPHGFQVKCPKKEIFAPECMESLWNPCGIHPHSRFIPCRVQKEVFSDYLHGIHGIHGICMDSTWIPHGFQTILPKENVCA